MTATMTTTLPPSNSGNTLTRPDYLDETAVAKLLDVCTKTLRIWRMTGRNDLPFYKIGRNVRYLRGDVLAWLESRRSTGPKLGAGIAA